MKKKKTFALGAALLSLAAISFGGLAGAVTGAEVVEGEAYTFNDSISWTDIATAEEFISAAQGGWQDGNYRLTADIDLGGATTQSLCSQGSTFNGYFDGQGYTVSNYQPNSYPNALFYALGSNSVIANTTFICQPTSASVAGVANSSSGLIEDCTVVMDLTTSLNTIAGFVYESQAGASYRNLATHYFIGSDATSSNTLLVLYNTSGDNTTEENITYTVNGVDNTANYLSKADSYTEATGVAWVGLSGDDTVAVGSSIELTTKIAGDSTDAEVSWSVDDSTKASISNGSASGATITGIEAGEVTVTVTVGDVSASKTITVESASAVTAVEISENALEIEEGLSSEVTITFTGNTYNSIVWTSSNEEYVTVEGTDTGATITGVQVTSDPVDVTVTVDPGNGADTVSDTVSVTVIEATSFEVRVLVPTTMDGPSTDIESAYVVINGSKYVGIERVTGANGEAVQINYSDDTYYIFKGTVSVTDAGIADSYSTYYITFNHSETGSWGTPITPNNFAEDTWTDIVFAAPNTGSQNNTIIGNDIVALDEAIAHVSAWLYGTDTWRDAEGSICWYVDGAHDDQLNNLLYEYDVLTDDAKAWADRFVDYGCSYGETIAMLKDRATNTGGTYTANVSSSIGLFGNMDTSLMIAMIVLVGAVAVLGIGGLIVYKRRHNEA